MKTAVTSRRGFSKLHKVGNVDIAKIFQPKLPAVRIELGTSAISV